jgi:hypothetical protein
MNKPTKSEIVPGLALRSTRFSEVIVEGWLNKSRGIVSATVNDGGPRQGDRVSLPMQVLRWQ